MNWGTRAFRKEKSVSWLFTGVLFYPFMLFFLSCNILFAESPRIVMIQDESSGKTLMVQGFSVRVGIPRTSLDRGNASFFMVDGLNGGGVSFRCKKSPNYYLIADGNQVALSYRKHSKWFQKMATFKLHERSDGKVQIESGGKPGYMLEVSGSTPLITTAGGIFRLVSPLPKPESEDSEPVPVQTINQPASQPINRDISQSRNTTEPPASSEQNRSPRPGNSESTGSWVMNVLSTQAKAIKSLFVSNAEGKSAQKMEETGTTETERTEPVDTRQVAEQTENGIDTAAAVPAVYKLPDMGDMNVLNDFVDTGAITTTMNLLKQLYGKLTPEQEISLRKQFAQYYEYPCDEVKEYFKKLNRELYKMLMLKTRLSVEMGGYGHAAAEATNALAFKNEKMAEAASRHLLQRRKKILAIQRQFAEINMHLNKIGTPPNALEIKKKHEKYFEDLIRLAETQGNISGSQSAESVSIDGIWEIREDDRVSDLTCLAGSDSGGNTLQYKKEKFKDLPENERFFMRPFSANKIYLKKMRDIGNGLSFLYVYLYDFYRYGAAIDADDTSLDLIMKQVGDNKYVIFRDLNHEANIVSKITIEVKDNTLSFVYENYPPISSNGKGYAYHKSYSYHLVEYPQRPSFHRDAVYRNWDEYEKDIFDGIREYTGLSRQEKETPFGQLPDYEDTCGMIREKVAWFRSCEARYKKEVSLFKGARLSAVKEDSLVWKLESVKISDRDVSAWEDHKSGDGAWHSSVYRMTSSKSSGWIKIWKIEEKTEEGHLNKTTKTKVATFTWQPPSKFFKQGTQWHINMKSSGPAQMSWMPMLSSVPEFEIAEFNSGIITMSPEVLARGDGAIELKGVVDGKSSVTVRYQFNCVSRGTETLTPEEQMESNEPMYLLASKEDFYKLQIQELTEKIAAYKEDMAKATTAEAKGRLEWNILGREAELQQQKDFLTQLKTGNFSHTETRWDRANAEISESRFLKESRVYQKKIHEFKYRMDMIRKIGGMAKKMKGQDELGVTRWANRQREQALKTKDNKKLAEIYDAVKKRYRQNLEEGIVNADQEVAFWDDAIEGAEYVKDKADTAFMIASTIQSGGTMYLYAGYTGLTNGISDGILSGVEHGLKSINMATMIAGSAYDGYNAVDPRTGKKAGLEGAAWNTAETVVILGLCHVAIKGVVKTCTVAKKAYSQYAFKSALTAQEREMSLTMVRQYEAKLQKIEKLMRRGEKAAAKEQAALMEKETTKLMANPHAKNYLKYNGSEITQRMYTRYENKVKEKVINRFKAEMEKKGWSKFNVKEFRNSASGDSLGMDWDLGLIEDKLKTMRINGKEVKVILKNGKPMTIGQFQNEAQKEFGKAYFKQTGYSAEGSFANLTTSVNKEAFADLNILKNPAMADKELAAETAKTVKYKAEFMLGKHSRGFVTKAGKMGEACRGLAKEIRTKLIPNLQQSKNSQKFLMDRVNGVDYFNRLQVVLQDFGKNKIGIVEAERSVRNLTGKSLNELPEFISSSVKKAIKAK